jgi:predicted nucleic acid-binding protein
MDALLQSAAGLGITGALGVLALSVKRKLLLRQSANDALTAMIASSYRSPLDRLDSLL